MSRIGKMPISIPDKVDINIDKENHKVKVKGPKGELEQTIDTLIKMEVEGTNIILNREGESKEEKSKHGLYRSLLQNMVTGVTDGFTTVQEFVGVGYKVDVKGQLLEMRLGFSHSVFLQLPSEIKAEAKTERGKNPLLTMTSCDKQLLGQVAAKIRSLRKPEPYKGKGVKFQGEVLRKKAGKAAAE